MRYRFLVCMLLFAFSLVFLNLSAEEMTIADTARSVLGALRQHGLDAKVIRIADFHEGTPPENFFKRTGAPYKPSYNENPSIPAQCWIETSYGTQNACLYCHTDYLSKIGHGNAFPLGEDQILYSFPTPDLNKVLWRNTIFPQEIGKRLNKEGISLPDRENVAYVRRDNWTPAFAKARPAASTGWLNKESYDFVLFPSLDPSNLFPYLEKNPTSDGTHGYVDQEGFVRDKKDAYTGWRAINFFLYGVFTPLSGSVSGIYIRLPRSFMCENKAFSLEIYRKNLDLLEMNIKNQAYRKSHYYGDASGEMVLRGFFPVGTEFAHPLHYVDLNADGETGAKIDGVVDNRNDTYEFPGTRSRRLKEMRYMYKWKEVGIDDIDEDAHPEEFAVGNGHQGWIDNNVGWLLAAFIEDRRGELRPQTGEELMQCLGCHGKVGNTVDSVWSFLRKLPAEAGWREMDYGSYDSKEPQRSRLRDYARKNSRLGELGYFYHTVVGADLYGAMPREIASELKNFSAVKRKTLNLENPIDAIFDDELLKNLSATERRSHLFDRQKIMRAYVADFKYLDRDETTGESYVKGSLLYPSEQTMKNNIWRYRKIVLDQSYNLGKAVFGSKSDNVPFTFRSDGTVKNAAGETIPVGEIIVSRPCDEEGVGTTPTGIVKVNAYGKPVDKTGNPVVIGTEPEKAVGHVSTGGTFDTMFNPILGDIPLRPGKSIGAY